MEKSSTNTQQFFNNTGAPCPSSTIAANPVSLSVTVQDTHTRYNGFEDLQSQNQQHNPTNIDYNSLTCTDTNDGSPTNTAVFCYSYTFWRGSVKRVKFSTHVNPLNFFKPLFVLFEKIIILFFLNFLELIKDARFVVTPPNS